MFASAMIWGTWVLVLSGNSLPGFFVTAITSFTGFLCLLVYILITRKQKLFLEAFRIPSLMKFVALIAFLEAIQNALFMVAFSLAIKDGGSVFIPLIRSFIGIITPIIAVFAAKKEFSYLYLLYGIISTIGAILIFSWEGLNTSSRISYLGLSMVIGSVIITSFVAIFQRYMALKMKSVGQQASVVITYQTLLSAIFLSPLVIGYLLLNINLVKPSLLTQLAYIGFFGLTHVALAFVLKLNALKHITAQQVVIIAYLEPVTSVALSIIFLKETINLGYIIGAILILGSAIAAGLQSTSSKQTLKHST